MSNCIKEVNPISHTCAKEWAQNWFSNGQAINDPNFWAFEFKKEDLEVIMKQDESTHIRFYLAQKDDPFEIFLLAIGADLKEVNGQYFYIDVPSSKVYRSKAYNPVPSTFGPLSIAQSSERVQQQLQELFFVNLDDKFNKNELEESISKFTTAAVNARKESTIPNDIAQKWIEAFQRDSNPKLPTVIDDSNTREKIKAWLFSKEYIKEVTRENAHTYVRFYLAVKQELTDIEILEMYRRGYRTPNIRHVGDTTLIMVGATNSRNDNPISLKFECNSIPITVSSAEVKNSQAFDFARPCPSVCDDDNSPIQPV